MATAETFLSRDPVMKRLIGESGRLTHKKQGDLYLALLRAIVGQQLSIKAAATIWQRFLAMFDDQYPAARQILAKDTAEFRSAGLSFQKAGYLRNIAEFSIAQSLDYKKLRSMPDEDLIQYLTQIKGVGRWTAEMILMFSLGRPDILPLDDLGIQNSIALHYGVRYRGKKHMYRRMEQIAERWRPYRSVACFYLWKAKDNAPVGKGAQGAKPSKLPTRVARRDARASGAK